MSLSRILERTHSRDIGGKLSWAPERRGWKPCFFEISLPSANTTELTDKRQQYSYSKDTVWKASWLFNCRSFQCNRKKLMEILESVSRNYSQHVSLVIQQNCFRRFKSIGINYADFWRRCTASWLQGMQLQPNVFVSKVVLHTFLENKAGFL